jgi:hypothetical protein
MKQAVPPHRKRLLAWMTANGLDPAQILEGAPFNISNGLITTEYVIRDANDRVVVPYGRSPLTRPHSVPLVHPIEEFEDPTPVREWTLAEDQGGPTKATIRVLADGRLQLATTEGTWTMSLGDSTAAAGLMLIPSPGN